MRNEILLKLSILFLEIGSFLNARANVWNSRSRKMLERVKVNERT